MGVEQLEGYEVNLAYLSGSGGGFDINITLTPGTASMNL